MKNKRRISIRKVILQPSNTVQEGKGGGNNTLLGLKPSNILHVYAAPSYKYVKR